VDVFALDFIRRREKTLEGIAAMRSKDPQPVEITTVMGEEQVKADIGGSNAKYAQGALRREMLNSYFNHPLVLGDFATGRGKNLDPVQPGSKGPALIIGSGPSLDDHHELIRGWKGGIFSSSSQATLLLALGQRAFNMVVVDVKTLSNELTPLAQFEGKDVTMITHPGMEPEVIQAWRWQKQYFRIIVHNIPFYTETMAIAYPMVRTTLYVYGCVAASQVMIAKLLGYNPLFLVGCDFGYPDEISRFTGFHWQPAEVGGTWVRDEPAAKMKYLLHPKVIYRNGCPSDHFQAYYKQTFFNSWRLSLSDIWRVGTRGGLYEVPSVDPEKLLRTQGHLPPEDYVYSARDKVDICERYLIRYGTYTFEFPSGQTEFVMFDEEFKAAELTAEADCVVCGKKTKSIIPRFGPLCSQECHLKIQVKKYLEMINAAMQQNRIPGVLILGEELGRLNHLRDDEAWARKEQRWRWEIMSRRSPTETPSEPPSESASGSIGTTGKNS
jgi:hypothetical protein